jgi:hypothetical protein
VKLYVTACPYVTLQLRSLRPVEGQHEALPTVSCTLHSSGICSLPCASSFFPFALRLGCGSTTEQERTSSFEVFCCMQHVCLHSFTTCMVSCHHCLISSDWTTTQPTDSSNNRERTK